MKMRSVKGKKLLAVLLVFLMAISLVGCSKSDKTNSKQIAKESNAKQQIVDMAGRTVEVPAQIDKVFSTSPVGMILVYTMAPEKLAGLNFEFTPKDAKYILPEFRELPYLGGWYAKATCNTEELMKIHPDIIISVGLIDETAISQADKIQKQLNIPVVVMEYDIEKLDKTYEFAGKLMGEEKRAGELAQYCRDTVKDIKAKSSTIAEDKKIRVYYAEGPKGLETDPKGSRHTQVLEMVGAVNVADVAIKGGMGMTPVSLEQVLNWNPDLILTWTMVGQESTVYDIIVSDPKWKQIKAVQNKEVYEIPSEPFNWFDRPPSVNRILGLKWLGNLLYPEIYDYDMVQETKEFYKKFYHYELNDQEVTEILDRASR